MWIDGPSTLVASLDRSPRSIGWKGFTKSPQTWHYPPQHQITTHYIECDKDPGMYSTPTKVASILLFHKYKLNTNTATQEEKYRKAVR